MLAREHIGAIIESNLGTRAGGCLAGPIFATSGINNSRPASCIPTLDYPTGGFAVGVD
jgi:hypothetical protein